MVETNEPLRDSSADLLRSSINLALDRDADSRNSTSRNDESNLSSMSAQSVSSWRRARPGLTLTLGFIAFIVGAAVFHSKFPNYRPTGAPDVFDFSCNDGADDPIEQKFALDLTFGSFTFSQAKTIDIVWDTVIGQGGRMLHGWILYRYVLHPFLVVLMEQFTVTPDFYISLSFSRSSIETLWTMLVYMFRRESITVFLCTWLVIYALGYTLLFSVIWAAATGYVSVSQNFYPMPDGEVVRLNSQNLSLCWVLDGARFGLKEPLVELGPDFANVGGSIKSVMPDSVKEPNATTLCFKDAHYENQILHYTASGWRLQNTTLVGSSSSNFRNIRDYSLTAQALRLAVSGHHWQQEAEPVKAVPNLWQYTNLTQKNVSASWWTNISSSCQDDHSPAFTGLGYAQSIVSPQYFSDQNTSLGMKADLRPFNLSGLDKAYWSRFVHNSSIAQNNLSALPYNSTIWLNDTAIKLDAPFLDVGHGCYSPSPFTGLGNCVCYKGQPIPVHFIAKEQAICRTVPGAVWGFSAFLTRLGLYLEASWMACCVICYGIMLLSSRVMKKDLIWTTSTRRSALVFSRAVRDIKGEGLDQLNEEEIASRLKGTQFGYPRQSVSCKERNDNEDPSAIRLVENPPHREDGLTDITNASVEKAAHQIKSLSTLARDQFRKRKPTTSEVYEDLNWRLYDRV
ncbi:hypothetical protein PG985_014725 [Apiospora marii]|uniref:Uncharacterized protein n=1 Tax=Apiospora marii TaxID=335849 RepID=A0ABR1R527_9PEZI